MLANKKYTIKTVFLVSTGSIIEWYDYALFFYFSTQIGDLFFPASNNPAVNLMWSFANLGLGLIVRPIGGIIFGYIGDRYSRKTLLSVSILLMALPTFGIGSLPTYHEMGVLAPILLLILRVTQGLALGGEFGASCVYLFESSPLGKKGFFSAIALSSLGIGMILSAGVILIIESTFTEAEIVAYAWRLPFFVSIIGAVISFFMRRKLLETSDFVNTQNNLVDYPLLALFKDYKLFFFNLLTILLVTKTAFYIAFIVYKAIMIQELNYSSSIASKFNLYGILGYTIFTLVFGYLSDLVNRHYLMLLGTIGILCISYPLFVLSMKIGSVVDIIMMSILFGAFIAMVEAPLNLIAIESFPANIRATSVTLCWNLAAGVFGGAALILSLGFIHYGGIITIAYYLMTTAIISFLAIIFHLKNHV